MPTATRSTRDRLVEAAATRMARDGYAATGVKAILTDAAAPYGSLYHHFPGGKAELGAAALRHSGAGFRELVELYFPEGVDLVAAVSGFFAGAAAHLEATDYADACPVATIALETASVIEPMRVAAAEVFESWLAVLDRRLREAGVDRDTARDVAVELFCGIEGAFLLARATRSAAPLHIAGRAGAARVQHALGAR